LGTNVYDAQTLRPWRREEGTMNAIDDAVRAVILNADEILRRADSPLPLLLILLGIFGAAVGIAAIIAAARFSAENPQHQLVARVVAFIGGGYTTFMWFGWPWVTQERQALERCVSLDAGAYLSCLLSPPMEHVENFSALALIGALAVSLCGVALHDIVASRSRVI
jgi:hypothetical protein